MHVVHFASQKSLQFCLHLIIVCKELAQAMDVQCSITVESSQVVHAGQAVLKATQQIIIMGRGNLASPDTVYIGSLANKVVLNNDFLAPV